MVDVEDDRTHLSKESSQYPNNNGRHLSNLLDLTHLLVVDGGIMSFTAPKC